MNSVFCLFLLLLFFCCCFFLSDLVETLGLFTPCGLSL